MLSLATIGASAFAPAAPALSSMRPLAAAQMTAIKAGDVGTTKPLGVYDPLGLMTSMPNKHVGRTTPQRHTQQRLAHRHTAPRATCGL
jgi:hypothetical protein